MKRKNKLIVGITGVIGSGKSTAAEFFRSKGYPVIDADKVGHKVLKDEQVKNLLVAEFGKEILEEEEISRKKLGSIVFNDKNKLHTLNKIVHPKIISQIKSKAKNIESSFIFIDAALLLDWNMDRFCDIIIMITADKSKLIKRLSSFRKHSENHARARVQAQNFKKEKADFIVSNNSTKREFYKKLEEILCKLQQLIKD